MKLSMQQSKQIKINQLKIKKFIMTQKEYEAIYNKLKGFL